ncbi:MAG: trehalase family glycosidase, partial [Ferruginibacter sp.]
MKTRLSIVYIFLLVVVSTFSLQAQPLVLKASSFKHYIDAFNRDDNELYKQYYPNNQAWDFLKNNIPFFDCPDKQLEATYYFRWWTFRKHIKRTTGGFVITEFLPAVSWAGKDNTINCAAGHHIYEGRWLHDTTIIRDYINFWFEKGGNLRSYSTWLADALYKYSSTKGDFTQAKELYTGLVSNYAEWEKEHLTKQGLFWSEDDRDGMEVSVSGNGLRPTLSSYMYADAKAIAHIAALSGDAKTETDFLAKAKEIKKEVLQKLWDKEDQFFKVIPVSSKDDSVDASQPFTNYGKRNVREILGFTPWYVNLPDSGYAIAWKQALSKEGFYALHGLTTTEQRNPSFRISYKDHECQWNGPSWPFSTSITLTALSNVLHNQ